MKRFIARVLAVATVAALVAGCAPSRRRDDCRF
jgi:predicted small secreted protein